MDRFNALGRGAQIMLVAGALFLISTFFNWQSVDIGVADVGVSAWHGFFGVAMGILAIVLVAWLVARVAGVTIPIPFSPALVGGALAVVIFVFALIKALTDELTTSIAWVGVVLAALLVAGAWLEVKAAGGIAAMKGEVTARSERQAAPPPPPPAAEEPAPPPPAAGPEQDTPSDRP
jgi:hypothetical protein